MPTRSKTLFSKFGHRQGLRQTVLPPYEKCVSVELVHYLDLHSLQSGLGNSTLMVSLLADILPDVDRSHIILLSLYDISVTFDTVDHIMCSHLGVTGMRTSMESRNFPFAGPPAGTYCLSLLLTRSSST